MIPKFLLLIFVVLFVFMIPPAYAQHHSGSLAPPIDLDGLKVAVSTNLFPENFVVPLEIPILVQPIRYCYFLLIIVKFDPLKL